MSATTAMNEAKNADEMADAFHPFNFGLTSHNDAVMDAAESALLWAAGRISRRDFFAALWDDEP